MMQGSFNYQPRTARQTLIFLRIVWAALLLGQFMTLAIFLFLLHSGQGPHQPESGHMLFLVSAAMLVTLVPIGWLIRRSMLRPGPDGLVGPSQYSTGNIIFYAMCEGAGFTGLIGSYIGGIYWPNLIVPIIVIAVQILHFPAAMNLRDSGTTIE